MKVINSRIILLFLIVFAVFAGLLGCSEQTAEPPLTIRIGYQPISANAPLYVGIESGMYEDAGLNCTLIPFQSSVDAIYAMQRGDIDILFAPPLNNIVDALENAPGSMQIISIHGNDEQHYFEAFIVPIDSPILTIQDFAEGTLGGYPGSFAETISLAIIANQTASEEIYFQTLDFGAQLAALSGGSIDMLFAYEPLVTIALNDSIARVVQGGPISKTFFSPFPVAGACISTEFRDSYPDEAALFVTINNEVMELMKDDRELVLRALSTHANLDSTIASQIHQCYFSPVNQAQKDYTERVLELFLNLGMIDQIPQIDLLFYENP